MLVPQESVEEYIALLLDAYAQAEREEEEQLARLYDEN
jgi:hypothetical protein